MEPVPHTVEGRKSADEELPGLVLHKVSESILPLAQRLLRDAVAAVLAAEEVQCVPVLAQTEDVPVGDRVKFLAAVKIDNAYPVF